MEYKAFYKCRLCGEIFDDGATTGPRPAKVTAVELALGIKPSYTMAPSLVWVHDCKDSSVGMADFIGWKVQNEQNRGD